MKAKKYQVGKIARKHLLAAIEVLFTYDEDCVVVSFRRYEIRATRKSHGVELMWAARGTFFNPKHGLD